MSSSYSSRLTLLSSSSCVFKSGFDTVSRISCIRFTYENTEEKAEGLVFRSSENRVNAMKYVHLEEHAQPLLP